MTNRKSDDELEWLPEPTAVSAEEFLEGLDDPMRMMKPPRKTALHRETLSKDAYDAMWARIWAMTKERNQ